MNWCLLKVRQTLFCSDVYPTYFSLLIVVCVKKILSLVLILSRELWNRFLCFFCHQSSAVVLQNYKKSNCRSEICNKYSNCCNKKE